MLKLTSIALLFALSFSMNNAMARCANGAGKNSSDIQNCICYPTGYGGTECFCY